MTMLSIVQTAAVRLGLTSPSAVATSYDDQYLQLLALLNEEASELAARHDWQVLNREATFTTVATEIQGTLATICPGLNRIINNTIYNRTMDYPIYGPVSPQAWQRQQAMASSNPYSSYRIKGNNLCLYPIPTAGESCYFEYNSKYYATDTTGATYKTSFTVDSDIALLNEDILTLGLIWRWKANKGLDFSVDYQKYEFRVINEIGRDGTSPVLDMNGSHEVIPYVRITP